MSIEDHNGEEMIRVPSPWTLLFKLTLMAAIPFAGTVCMGGVWVVTQIFSHDTRLSVLEDRSRTGHADNSNTNIITSDATKMADSKSGKGYLTTTEVAKREQCDPRTILNYIADNRIVPTPVKEGKEWVISEAYRILPKPSEIVGTLTVKPAMEGTEP